MSIELLLGSVKSIQAANSGGRWRAVASLLLKLLSVWDVISFALLLNLF